MGSTLYWFRLIGLVSYEYRMVKQKKELYLETWEETLHISEKDLNESGKQESAIQLDESEVSSQTANQ